MKVLINAINARQGGGQTYLLNLLSSIPSDEDIKATLLVGASFDEEFLPDNINVLRVAHWIEKPLFRPWWERLVLPRILKQEGYDVLFCPGGVVNTKYKGCKIVTMSRNLLPFDKKQRVRYPLFSYQRLRNWMLARIMSRSMLAADLVIFVSEFAKEVVERSLPVSMKGTVVIPHGIADQFRSNVKTPLTCPEGIPARYLLYVSNIDVYKSQIEVVRAFALILPNEIDLKLLLVGPESEFYAKTVREEISSLGLSDNVIMLGSISYSRLPALYQHALINIFASQCENCPNILLEMMASGRPVMCSNFPPMPEFGGDSVMYFDPENPEELAAQLKIIMNDPELQEKLNHKTRQKVQSYNWKATSERTWREIMTITQDGRQRV